MAHTLEQNQAQEKMSDFSRLFSEIKSQQITCLICLNSISEETVSRIKECKHLFCYECISKWAKTKLTCPLCTKKFEVIEFHFASDGTCEEKKFEEPTKRPDDVDVDLSCLDFNYFLDEVNRLLENGERLFAMTKALARQNGKVHLHFSNDSKLTPTLHTVLCTLRNIQTDLLNEVRFDPLVLIQQLYDIENTLKELWNGRTPTSMPQHSQRTETSLAKTTKTRMKSARKETRKSCLCIPPTQIHQRRPNIRHSERVENVTNISTISDGNDTLLLVHKSLY
jgi:hypothetical protein